MNDTREKWDQEGVLENMLGMDGVDILFYINHKPAVHHFILIVDGREYESTRLHVADVGERAILDGVKAEWELAQHAARNGDLLAVAAFTWRGMRLLFPSLPEDPWSD